MREGRHVAAICAGPSILANLGLLEGRKATCYPGVEATFPKGVYQNILGVYVDENLITASGPGQALEFGFTILATLTDVATAKQVAQSMLTSYQE